MNLRWPASGLLLFLAFAGSEVLAAGGTLVSVAKEPIVGARVCYIHDRVELLCVETDERGRYDLPTSKLDTLRALAAGYLPRTFSAAAQQAPIVLQKSPTLLVRLVNGKTGERISEGEVVVIFSSGKEIGPFPVNAAGVRIRRLIRPGEIRVLGRAEGFHDADPAAVKLVAGEESELELELEPLSESKPEG